jgi:hypothetical protein
MMVVASQSHLEPSSKDVRVCSLVIHVEVVWPIGSSIKQTSDV